MRNSPIQNHGETWPLKLEKSISPSNQYPSRFQEIHLRKIIYNSVRKNRAKTGCQNLCFSLNCVLSPKKVWGKSNVRVYWRRIFFLENTKIVLRGKSNWKLGAKIGGQHRGPNYLLFVKLCFASEKVWGKPNVRVYWRRIFFSENTKFCLRGNCNWNSGPKSGANIGGKNRGPNSGAKISNYGFWVQKCIHLSWRIIEDP